MAVLKINTIGQKWKASGSQIGYSLLYAEHSFWEKHGLIILCYSTSSYPEYSMMKFDVKVLNIYVSKDTS
jgi:hypothetical protein